MSFPIIGIGASAGGLEALIEFTGALDPTCKVAFIVVQHFSPESRSILSELLAARTKLTVKEAIDGAEIQPYTMYVIPAGTVMAVDDGHLQVSARIKTVTTPTPIDRLFESLADEEGKNGIGILFSGTGNDGASGLRAIKSAGGLTFAQDEASCKHFEMPKAAISLDAVDRILPPYKIADEITRLINHPYFSHQSTSAPELTINSGLESEGLIRKILVELKVRTGVDFSLYKKGTVRRRLARRLAINSMNDLEDYLSLLKSSREECEVLSRELLIQVTDFFRDPDVFEGLTHLVLPQLFPDDDEIRPIRIWVPGCATGEEVYSIAIAILEYLGTRATVHDIQLFGTDLSDSSIETARSGQYPETISRHVSEERLQRFFVKKNGGYRIASSIRNLCVFARQNVVDDPPFSRLDLVSCRNLLIYLDAPLQKKVMSLFNYALRPGGFLILGPSESVGATSELFSPVDKRLRIFSKKLLPGKITSNLFDPLDRFTQAPSPRKSLHSIEQSESERWVREAERAAMRRYVPPGVLCDSDFNILEYRGDTTPFIGNPVGPPSHNLQKLIRPALLVELSNAIRTSHDSHEPVLINGLRVDDMSARITFSAEIIPVEPCQDRSSWFWVFFTQEVQIEKPENSSRIGVLQPVLKNLERRIFPGHRALDEKNVEITRLSHDLESARSYVRNLLETHEATMEELSAAEEELLSSNEEFQSTNEELQTAQEELQSSNDELRARNRELSLLNEELTQARDFSEAIVETVCQPLLVLDSGMIIRRANPAFFRVFQLRPEHVEGTNFFELGPDQWISSAIRDTLCRIIPENVTIENMEMDIANSKLGNRALRMNAQCLNWNHDAGVLMLLEDITEQRAAIRKLQQMDLRKDEFMAMLAHELRNPLTPIRNALEIWRQGKASAEEICHIQQTMDRQLTQEARLIDDLVDLSRINRGAISLRKEPTDLARIAFEAIDDNQSNADSHQHELTINISSEPMIVQGDPIRLSQVISNLLSNAIRYTPNGGKINIALVREGAKAMLSVTDNGIGIDPSQIPDIFDMFVQAERSVARTEGGLGIGLTLVKRLVELHEGDIRAYSEGLGRGSCFTVRIPMMTGQIETVFPEPIPETPLSMPQLASRRILIVDDNEDGAETLSMFLNLHGHTTEIALDGHQALEVVEGFCPDVVLLDIGLPGLDGYQVVKRLRKIESLKSPLIIAISGYGQPSDIQKSFEAGFDHHMTKPADTNQLLRLID